MQALGEPNIAVNAKPLRVLVLGAYGFLGQAIARELLRAGHRVSGLGRSAKVGKRILPELSWSERDLATMDRVELWVPILENIDVVVNASGALQDGARDDLRASQDRAIQSLIEAGEKSTPHRFVQISAPGADPEGPTRFQRTKGRADQRLRHSSLDWVILRPGLVIGRSAYGGTALLRMLAALPLVQPLAQAEAPIQCVSLDEVASITARAAAGGLPTATCLDLVEAEPHTLREVVTAMGRWLGRPPPLWTIEVPAWLGHWVGRGADGLGHLGWRSPLRSTALRTLEKGVTADPSAALALLGQPLMNLEQILALHPATLQDRWFARLYLMLPLIITTLAGFWLATGIITLFQLPNAVAWLPNGAAATTFVVVASCVDIALGLAILFRPWTQWACWGMVLVTAGYLLGATWLVPELWLDPLGPLLKPIPAMVLALITPTLVMER
jgi:uncharacterized protein YbjT (DUF2867 family)